MRNNVYSDVDMGIWFYQYELKIKNFEISYTIHMKNCEGMTSSTRSFEYS